MVTFTCIRCGDQASRMTFRKGRFCLPCAFRRDDECRAAIKEVRKLIYRGILPRASDCVCVDCGKPGKDYDHRDYTKPVDVAPVCRSCNQKRGPAYDSLYRPDVRESHGSAICPAEPHNATQQI